MIVVIAGKGLYDLAVKSFIDRYYRHIRPFRFLYGWAKDRSAKAKCTQRAEEWRTKGFLGAKLDICGGRNPVNPEEFLNVDIVELPKVDLVFDIEKRFPIPSGAIAEIFSAATLEHLRKEANMHVLREFFRVLMAGGRLKIITPDIEAIARGVLAGDNLDDLNQHLFGKYKSEQTEDYDLHKWMFPAKRLMEALEDIGFREVEQLPMTDDLHDPRYNFLIAARKPMKAYCKFS